MSTTLVRNSSRVALVCIIALTAAHASDAPALLQTHSDFPYVHNITLYDADGAAIDPTDSFAGPYSPEATCGKCHPINTINFGWHFNALNPDLPSGRRGEPWWLVERNLGIVAPLSYREWPGAFQPAAFGLTQWNMLARFGRHIPGGSFGAPRRFTPHDPQSERWRVSGKLEIDCMICHAQTAAHDPAEQSRQIDRQNHRWSPTAAAGLASIRGDAKDTPDDWDPLLPPNPDYPDQSGPALDWNTQRFDADDRVLFDISRRVPNERCLFCHTSHAVGPAAPAAHQRRPDVHLAAGLLCVDCHRNGLNHAITRGYPDEAQHFADPGRAALTCAGCHHGDPASDDPLAQLGGALAAPRPQHPGLPPLHLESMTCTSCHSGPWPEDATSLLHTAAAHALGIPTRDRAAVDSPHILAPVFTRNAAGRITPERMVWPSFWIRYEAPDQVAPIALAEVRRAVAQARQTLAAGQTNQADQSAAGGQASPSDPASPILSDELVTATLRILAESEGAAAPAYVRGGALLSLTNTGALRRQTARDANAPAKPDAPPRGIIRRLTQPYTWPIAHNVRPAAHSLGSNGCTDCHANGAPFYDGSTQPRLASVAEHTPAQTMATLHNAPAALTRAWNASFTLRPAFKLFSFGVLGILLVLCLRGLLDAFGPRPIAVTPTTAHGQSAPPSTARNLLYLTFLLVVAYQAFTGFGFGLFAPRLVGWTLLAHMLGAAVFLAVLLRVALRVARMSDTNPAARQFNWLVVWLATLTAGSILLAFLPWFGQTALITLVDLHWYAALGLLCAIIAQAWYLASQRNRTAEGAAA